MSRYGAGRRDTASSVASISPRLARLALQGRLQAEGVTKPLPRLRSHPSRRARARLLHLLRLLRIQKCCPPDRMTSWCGRDPVYWVTAPVSTRSRAGGPSARAGCAEAWTRQRALRVRARPLPALADGSLGILQELGLPISRFDAEIPGCGLSLGTVSRRGGASPHSTITRRVPPAGPTCAARCECHARDVRTVVRTNDAPQADS
jgi:hypothetical protein